MAPKGRELQTALDGLVATDKHQTQPGFKQLVNMELFRLYIGKLLEYTDEVYYVEKKLSLIEDKERLAVKLIHSETERINQKAVECAYAYSAVLYKTVWNKTLSWEVVSANLSRS